MPGQEQSAIQDRNQKPGLIAHSGTADDATLIRLVATAGGALTTDASVTVGTVAQVTNIVGGTIGSILGIGGTVTVSGASAGTNVNVVTGTQQTLGTVGVLNAGRS